MGLKKVEICFKCFFPYDKTFEWATYVHCSHENVTRADKKEGWIVYHTAVPKVKVEWMIWRLKPVVWACIQSLQSLCLPAACWLSVMNGPMYFRSNIFQAVVITACTPLTLEINGLVTKCLFCRPLEVTITSV